MADAPVIYYVSDTGETAAERWPNVMSSYTEPLFSYHAAIATEWLSDVFDAGLALTGSWTVEVNNGQPFAIGSGTVTLYLELSDNGTNWLQYPGGKAKRAARFARVRISAAPDGTLFVYSVNTRVDAVPHTEYGAGTSSASGPITMQLTGTYTAVKTLTLTPEGSTDRNAIPDRILVSSQSDGLVFYNESTRTASENSYSYWAISNVARTIQSGDTLEYDVFIETAPDLAPSGHQKGGMEIDFSDGTFGRSLGLTCSNGTGTIDNPANTTPLGQWYSRKIPLEPAVGKTSAWWDVARGADTAGPYKSIYRNIRITDGAGNLRLQLWASGEPTVNQNRYSAYSANQMVGPTNSFLASVFDTAGSRIASSFRYTFEGV